MRRRSSFPQRLAALLTLTVFLLTAQETNQSIINMVKEGIGEDIVLDVVNRNTSSFAVGSTDLVELKRAGVPERIITAIRNKTLGPSAAAKPAEAARPKGAPQEGGVYYKKGDAWVEVLSEEIAWSNAGVVNSVRNVASAGLLKRDVSGTIAQPSSHSMLTSPFELLIVPTGGLDIHRFLLLPPRRTKVARELEMGPAKKGEAVKRAIPFGVEKVGSNQFKMYFPSPLAPGEYGILPMNQIATENGENASPSGRVFTFRVLL